MRKIILISLAILIWPCFQRLYAQESTLVKNTYVNTLSLLNIYTKYKDSAYIDSLLHMNYYTMLKGYAADTNTMKSNPLLREFVLKSIPRASFQVSKNMRLRSMGRIKYIESKSFYTAPVPTPNYKPSEAEALSWESSAINGISNFMAGRFRQEILHMAIDNMFGKIQQDKLFMKYLFPKSYQQIKSIYNQGSSSYYSSDFVILKQTAERDLLHFSENIVDNFDSIFQDQIVSPSNKDMMKMGYGIIRFSREGQSIPELMVSLSKIPYSNQSNTKDYLLLATILSQGCRDTLKAANTWIQPRAKFKSLNTPEARLYYGLLYEQLIKIPSLAGYLGDIKSQNIDELVEKINRLTDFVHGLNTTFSFLQSKKNLLNNPETQLEYLIKIDRSLGSLFRQLNTIPSMSSQGAISEEQLLIPRKIYTVLEVVYSKEIQRIIPTFTIEFGEYFSQNRQQLKLLSFMSQLATISSSEDMRMLLEAYTVPIGGASIKRNTLFNISLNGYVWMTAGNEIALGKLEHQPRGNFGLAAPIGFAFTFQGKWTAFFSVIDLGSIVNQRLNNDTNSYSNIKFEHFFAPGIGGYYNIRKTPFTVGVHANFIPNLRTIKYENNLANISESNVNVLRINASLLVDIPFFTLYNRARR